MVDVGARPAAPIDGSGTRQSLFYA